VYAAAKAVGEDAVGGWLLYAEWLVWVWRGKVGLVVEKLQGWQEQHGSPGKGEAETSPRRVVAKARRYFRNNQGRMKYEEYRQQGLPLVSSLVESMVKQIRRGVKDAGQRPSTASPRRPARGHPARGWSLGCGSQRRQKGRGGKNSCKILPRPCWARARWPPICNVRTAKRTEHVCLCPAPSEIPLTLIHPAPRPR
jgi:hypothetical protein